MKQDFHKVLIINPYGIGDVLFTLPVISNLRLAYPQISLSYLANRRTSGFLKSNPDLAQIFVYERDEFVKDRGQYFDLYRAIKKERFDAVLDFSLNSSFGFLGLACGIRTRIGFDFRRRGRFLTEKVSLSGYEGRHVVEYYLDLLRCLSIPVVTRHMALDVPAADIQWAGEWLYKHKTGANKPLVAIVPGGGASWGKAAGNKRWPVAKYAHLIDKIVENFDADIILMGDSREEDLCREVAKLAAFPVHFAAGQTSILGMAALFQRCQLVVLNDGGPLHVAVAAGARTVSIFGPVDPEVYGPYPAEGHVVVQKKLPCQPCYRQFRQARCSHIDCLSLLSVDEVYRKVQSVL